MLPPQFFSLKSPNHPSPLLQRSYALNSLHLSPKNPIAQLAPFMLPLHPIVFTTSYRGTKHKRSGRFKGYDPSTAWLLFNWIIFNPISIQLPCIMAALSTPSFRPFTGIGGGEGRDEFAGGSFYFRKCPVFTQPRRSPVARIDALLIHGIFCKAVKYED